MEKIFNVTANVFVVPNSLQFNKKTGEVTCQLWFTAEENGDHYKANDITSHGITFKDAGETHISNCNMHAIENFPIHKLCGKKEGDVIHIELPILLDRTSPLAHDTIVNITATLKQAGYRYEQFGRFEEVLGKLIENFR